MKTLLAGAALLLCAALHAAPLIDEPVSELKLLNGRLLHNAQAKSFASAVVGVRSDEGIATFPYDQFPVEFQADLNAKRPRAKTAQEIASAKAAVAARVPKPSDDPKPDAAVSRGLRIVSFSICENYHREWNLEIANETPDPVDLFASRVIGEDSAGIGYPAQHVHYRGEENGYIAIPGGATVQVRVDFDTPYKAEPINFLRWVKE